MTKDGLKNIFLVCLFILFAVFFAMWYFKTPDNTKEANKLLQEQIDRIQRERDSLTNNIKLLEGKAVILEDSIRNGEKRIAIIDLQLQGTQARLVKANKDVQVAAAYYSSLQQKLANLQKNPDLKNGDALLQSLKEKLNR